MTLQPSQPFKPCVLETASEQRMFSQSQDAPMPDFVCKLLHEVRSTWQLETHSDGAGVSDYLPLLLGAGAVSGVRRLLG